MRNSLWLTGFGLAAAAVLTAPASASAAPAIMDHDGPYTVGTDVAVGYYTTHNATPSCQWARLAPTDGSIIQRGDGGNGTVTVEIQGTDGTFATSGCGTWAVDGGQRTGTGPTGTGSFGL
ncbi:hypothetical protein ACIP5Y_21910 [Nocardia sp. NPDC088792]|uniref:hypothetical protein n=1 Tax=Nocardia sp. NPDC088792 TaxID=3364332 RepID=UPI003824EB49